MLPLTEDKLSRENFLNDLFRMFDSFGNRNGHGLTMVINGKYGSGKSTLLGFIEEKNQNENKYDIIKYDAWENNFSENPIMPILYSISKLESTKEKIKETAKNVLKSLPKAILSTLSLTNNVDLQPFINNENFFDEYDSYKKAIEKFKHVLSSHCTDKKTIFLVDELDRCLPDYQIKVLESLYHLLDIPNLIVVIALDKDQLENSIQSKFGTELNSHGYLAKFIQYEIDLTEGDTYNYVSSLIRFKTKEYNHYEVLLKFAEALKSINLPIRECLLIVEKLNLLFDDNKLYFYYFPFMAGILLILKHIDNKTYKTFFSEKKDYVGYNSDPIPLSKTPFHIFLESIKGKEFDKILQLWRSDDGYGHSLYLHFINLFYPIGKITIESLCHLLNSTPENISSRFNHYDHWNFPQTTNSLIDKIEILI